MDSTFKPKDSNYSETGVSKDLNFKTDQSRQAHRRTYKVAKKVDIEALKQRMDSNSYENLIDSERMYSSKRLIKCYSLLEPHEHPVPGSNAGQVGHWDCIPVHRGAHLVN